MPTQIAAPPGAAVIQALGKELDMPPVLPNPVGSEIVWVWKNNLEEEMKKMRDVAETYEHVALDAQFPRHAARPIGPFNDYSEYNYQTLRCNVDLTKVLQISVTFADERGNRPQGPNTWRFNFEFDPGMDVYMPDESFETRGMDLGKHLADGINPEKFAESLITSGLVLNDSIRWITYGGLNGFREPPPQDGGPGRPAEPAWLIFCGLYDFGYLLQHLTQQALPSEFASFKEKLDLWFPNRCDVAQHMHWLGNLGGDELRKRDHRSEHHSFFRNAHLLSQAFFCLPENVRRTAFDKPDDVAEEETDKSRKAIS